MKLTLQLVVQRSLRGDWQSNHELLEGDEAILVTVKHTKHEGGIVSGVTKWEELTIYLAKLLKESPMLFLWRLMCFNELTSLFRVPEGQSLRNPLYLYQVQSNKSVPVCTVFIHYQEFSSLGETGFQRNNNNCTKALPYVNHIILTHIESAVLTHPFPGC